jgi:hypothetical protein
MQNYKNHTQYNPLHHFILSPITLIVFIMAIVAWFQAEGSYFNSLVATGLLLVTLVARLYALKLQDRVIRLEMRQRYFELSGKRFAEMEAQLTLKQIIALRFASDEELLPLIDRARSEKLSSKAIKEAVKNWVPDTNRV